MAFPEKGLPCPYCLTRLDRAGDCPHCGRTLPAGYGKHPVRMIPVVGAAGAGKRTWLSLMLERVRIIAGEMGLMITGVDAGVLGFLEAHPVKEGLPLEWAENREDREPLCLHIRIPQENREETLVFYIMELYNLLDSQSAERWLEQADGLVILLEPGEPNRAWHPVNRILGLVGGNPCPVAVCLTKGDTWEEGEDAEAFLRHREPLLGEVLECRTERHAMFPLTCLGGGVTEFTGPDGIVRRYPAGPVEPKGIEAPLLWLFRQFGYELDQEPTPQKPGFFRRFLQKLGNIDPT